MDVAARLTVLDRLYALYDRFVATQVEFACRKGCAACCTCNVTLTTLEAMRILDRAEPAADLVARLAGSSKARQRFRPTLTTNQIAERVRSGETVLEEGGDPSWGACPLLDEDACSLYDLRPFGCRSFFSLCDCSRQGVADVPPVLVSVNTVFLQTIEHLDRPGCSGNLTDVLMVLASPKNREAYREGRLDCSESGLLSNRAMPVLMVPPEHREAVMPIIQAIRSVRPPGN